MTLREYAIINSAKAAGVIAVLLFGRPANHTLSVISLVVLLGAAIVFLGRVRWAITEERRRWHHWPYL